MTAGRNEAQTRKRAKNRHKALQHLNVKQAPRLRNAKHEPRELQKMELFTYTLEVFLSWEQVSDTSRIYFSVFAYNVLEALEWISDKRRKSDKDTEADWITNGVL